MTTNFCEEIAPATLRETEECTTSCYVANVNWSTWNMVLFSMSYTVWKIQENGFYGDFHIQVLCNKNQLDIPRHLTASKPVAFKYNLKSRWLSFPTLTTPIDSYFFLKIKTLLLSVHCLSHIFISLSCFICICFVFFLNPVQGLISR